MNATAKHTPWTVRRDDSGGEIGLWSVIDANGNIVFFGMEEDRAHLFAAAPEMREALTVAEHVLRAHGYEVSARICSEAIAKSEGCPDA